MPNSVFYINYTSGYTAPCRPLFKYIKHTWSIILDQALPLPSLYLFSLTKHLSPAHAPNTSLNWY